MKYSEAGKGDKRVPEASRGNYERGHDAIDWSTTRTERQADQDYIERQRAENASRAK